MTTRLGEGLCRWAPNVVLATTLLFGGVSCNSETPATVPPAGEPAVVAGLSTQQFMAELGASLGGISQPEIFMDFGGINLLNHEGNIVYMTDKIDDLQHLGQLIGQYEGKVKILVGSSEYIVLNASEIAGAGELVIAFEPRIPGMIAGDILQQIPEGLDPGRLNLVIVNGRFDVDAVRVFPLGSIDEVIVPAPTPNDPTDWLEAIIQGIDERRINQARILSEGGSGTGYIDDVYSQLAGDLTGGSAQVPHEITPDVTSFYWQVGEGEVSEVIVTSSFSGEVAAVEAGMVGGNLADETIDVARTVAQLDQAIPDEVILSSQAIEALNRAESGMLAISTIDDHTRLVMNSIIGLKAIGRISLKILDIGGWVATAWNALLYHHQVIDEGDFIYTPPCDLIHQRTSINELMTREEYEALIGLYPGVNPYFVGAPHKHFQLIISQEELVEAYGGLRRAFMTEVPLHQQWSEDGALSGRFQGLRMNDLQKIVVFQFRDLMGGEELTLQSSLVLQPPDQKWFDGVQTDVQPMMMVDVMTGNLVITGVEGAEMIVSVGDPNNPNVVYYLKIISHADPPSLEIEAAGFSYLQR